MVRTMVTTEGRTGRGRDDGDEATARPPGPPVPPLAPPRITVDTTFAIAADPATIWDRLLFYEQIDQRPPLHLRLLLPVPIETVGRKSEVGDEARCLYEGGFLIKRVTHIDPPRRYGFEIAEQALSIGGGMRLAGGDYTIEAEGAGRSRLCITTRYTSARWPRWVWRPVERAVCHSFHRHILGAMRRAIEVPA